MIVITGDSHVTALAKALRSFELEKGIYKAHALGNGAHFAKPFFETTQEGIRLTNKQMVSFSKAFLMGEDTFCPLEGKKFGLSLGFYSARVTSSIDWKTHYVVNGFRTEHDQVPVSSGMIEAIIQQDLKYIFQFYQALQKGGAEVTIIPAPPPSRRLRTLKRGVPAGRVMELNHTYLSIAQSACETFGFKVLRYPEGCTDECGFLLEEYAHEKKSDHLHAGQPYALKMAEIVREAFGF